MEVGAYTYGHDKIKVWWPEMANIKIGKFCSIALDGVEIYAGGNHHTEWISTYPFGHIHQNLFNTVSGENHPISKGDITIGNDVWIGNYVKIFSGVTIGDGAVIGAYSVITKDVPPYTIVAGNPGEVRRNRFSDEDTAYLLDLKWWDLPVEKINEIAPLLCSQNFDELKVQFPQKKNAIVISGEYRTFAQTKDNLKKFIDDNSLDVYCHIWSNDPLEIEDIKTTLNPKKFIIEWPGTHDEEFDNVENEIRNIRSKGQGIDNLKNMASMYWSRTQAFNQIEEDYGVIVYSRYDVQIPNSFRFGGINTILTPQAEFWGMISDIFAIMPAEYAKYYFLYPEFIRLQSTEFEQKFIDYLLSKYPEESVRIHNYERHCPHMMLLRNLIMNDIPFEVYEIPLYLQR